MCRRIIEENQRVSHVCHADTLLQCLCPNSVDMLRPQFLRTQDFRKIRGAVTLKEAKEITDAFEKVYGSDATDEMWEEGTYRDWPAKQPRESSGASLFLRIHDALNCGWTV